MCGIAAYIGNNVKENLLNALNYLEYRGYDSAGISYFYNNKLHTIKTNGKVDDLIKIVPKCDFFSSGIAHTRWATHGKANKENAHPHNAGNWSIVHNGVIDNYKELNHYKTISQTDTEIIVQMLNEFEKENKIETLIDVCSRLNGSYALACLNKNNPNEIYLAKNQSPLYIGKDKGKVLISSDLSFLNGKCDYFFCLEDGEFASVNLKTITFYNKKHEKISKKQQNFNIYNNYFSKKTEKHFMLSEIKEIDSALNNTLQNLKNKKLIPLSLAKKINEIVFIACGTAYHSGLMISRICEEKYNIPSKSLIASEFNSSNQLINKKALYVFISQSGETADTILALKKVKESGAKTVALTNAIDSTITSKSDYTIYTSAGKEIAVASTKAYNCQILAGVILCYYTFCTKSIINFSLDNFDKSLSESLSMLKCLINREDEYLLANKFQNIKECFFIGKNFDYITSMEASLKLKEISYINCSAFPSGELKHGTLALIKNGSLVIAICTDINQKKKIETSLNEVKSRGAQTIVISQFRFDSSICDYYLPLFEFNEDIINIASIIPMQKLSYYVSLLKGYNPDKPRNLAKSVTVE